MPQPTLSGRPVRLLVVGLLALAVTLPGTVSFASAQQARNLRLVTPNGERPNAVFPANTRAVEARFDYTDASQTSLALIVYGPGGVRLMRQEAKYDGSGTASVTITGKQLLAGLTSITVNNVQEMQRAVNEAANASAGLRERLRSVQAAMMLVRNGLHLASWSNLPAEARAREDDLERALADLDKQLAVAQRLDDSDNAGLRGVAQNMVEPAGRAVTAVQGFAAAVKDLDIPIMSTGQGTNEAQAYDLSVLVDGIPAASTMMWVTLSVYLPFAHQSR
jgi:hypothetical protein